MLVRRLLCASFRTQLFARQNTVSDLADPLSAALLVNDPQQSRMKRKKKHFWL